MDTCFWLPLLWVIGASVLAGLLGWFLASRKSNKSNSDLNVKDLEIQNLKRELGQVSEKADNALAGLGRETRELEEKLVLWKEKFNKLQLQTADFQPSDSKEDIKKLEDRIVALDKQNLELETKLNAKPAVAKPVAAAATKTITKDLSAKLKKQYQAEISDLKKKLKKSKAKLKEAKKHATVTKEIEITKSIDIESLKKLLDKVPLKKVSERVIDRRKGK